MPMFKCGCVVLLLISASACSGSGSTALTAPSPTVTSVTLRSQFEPRLVNINAFVGAEDQLTVVENLSNSTNRVVTPDQVAWSSSNPTVATVSPAGLVTVKGPGSVTIYAVYQGVTVSIDFSLEPYVG
jgi:Big-like domain-containing protein